MDYTKLESGIRGLLVKYDYNKFGFLYENTWIKHMLKFLHESGIAIDDDLEDFELTREDASNLVSVFDIAYTYGLISKGA